MDAITAREEETQERFEQCLAKNRSVMSENRKITTESHNLKERVRKLSCAFGRQALALKAANAKLARLQKAA